MDNSDICVTHNGVTKRFALPGDVGSLHTQVGKAFDELPSKWSLTYTVEVQDALDYLFFLKKGLKFFTVESSARPTDTEFQALFETAPTGPKKHSNRKTAAAIGPLSPQSPFKSPTFRILSPTLSPKGKLRDNSVVRNLVTDLLSACKDSLTDLLSPPKACKQVDSEEEKKIDMLVSPLQRPVSYARNRSRKNSEPNASQVATEKVSLGRQVPLAADTLPPPPPGPPAGGRNLPATVRSSSGTVEPYQKAPEDSTAKKTEPGRDSLLSPRTEKELEGVIELTYQNTNSMKETSIRIHQQESDREDLIFVANVGRELKLEEDSLPKRSNEIVLPAPPTSAYEVCSMLGVESAALAVLAPPPLLTPRYRYRHTPAAVLPPDMAKALSEMVLPGVPKVHLAINEKISPRPKLEAHRDCERGVLIRREPQSNTNLRFMDPRFPVDYQKLLKHQFTELNSLNESHTEYSNMMKEYEIRNEEFFKNNQRVANSTFDLPLDEEAKIKRKLAGLIGVHTWDD